MSPKELVRRFYGELINRPDLAAIEKQLPDFIAADYLDHNAPDARGPAGYLGHLRALRTTFPDFRLEVLDLIAEGEWVACRVRGRGTHRGDFLGLKATGRHIDVRGINFDRVVDGRIAEHYGEADTFGMLLAMGLTVPPALARSAR
jgi:predicted ester cyclase